MTYNWNDEELQARIGESEAMARKASPDLDIRVRHAMDVSARTDWSIILTVFFMVMVPMVGGLIVAWWAW